MKTKQQLVNDGFTDSGIARYVETLGDYSDSLHSKAKSYGEAEKADGMTREVTHDHVRAAAYTIAKSIGSKKASPWMVTAQVAEYVLTAVGAYALGNTAEPWGIPLFVIAAVVAGILVAVRLSRSN